MIELPTLYFRVFTVKLACIRKFRNFMVTFICHIFMSIPYYAPNFEKVGGHIGSACPYVCTYVCTYVCMYVFMFEISS